MLTKLNYGKTYSKIDKVNQNGCLPCVRGGAEVRGGGVVKKLKNTQNKPSPPAAELPLHKGAVCFAQIDSLFWYVRFVSSLEKVYLGFFLFYP